MLHLILVYRLSGLANTRTNRYKITMPDRKKEQGTKEKGENCKQNIEDTATRDQAERRYYYDDAHGYEDFDPGEADEEDESDET